MNLKPKATKRIPAVPAPRPPGRAGARRARGPDLGERRLQLLLAAVR
jgi:hypothetical protein